MAQVEKTPLSDLVKILRIGCLSELSHTIMKRTPPKICAECELKLKEMRGEPNK